MVSFAPACTMSPIDRLYAQSRAQVADFSFDEEVVRIFPDMIRRSVPGYHDLVRVTAVLAERYAQPHSNIYDLGCSLGAVAYAVFRRLRKSAHPTADIRLIGIDSSRAMIAAARAQLPADIGLLHADARTAVIENASVVIGNFLLQFLNPADRDPFLRRIHGGLLPGGALLLAEKVIAADAAEEALLRDLHTGFKSAMGYSDLEIKQKNVALRLVMRPDPLSILQARLRDAGFGQATLWFRCLNFVALLAIRE